MPKINFKGVSDGFEPLPEDDYAAKLKSWKWTPAKDKKSNKLELIFTVTEGEYEGRQLWSNKSDKPDALWAMKRALTRLGADPDVIGDEDGFDLEDVMPDLVGNECVLRVTQYEYPEDSGEYRNNVQDILEADAVTV